MSWFSHSAQECYEKAQKLRERKKLAAALDWLEEAIELEPDNLLYRDAAEGIRQELIARWAREGKGAPVPKPRGRRRRRSARVIAEVAVLFVLAMVVGVAHLSRSEPMTLDPELFAEVMPVRDVIKPAKSDLIYIEVPAEEWAALDEATRKERLLQFRHVLKTMGYSDFELYDSLGVKVAIDQDGIARTIH